MAFLDEPTAGVDPEGRIAVRAVVAGLKEKGVCVVLTTHELGEAEKMADRIVILSAGRVVLEGTPHGLTAGAGAGAGSAAAARRSSPSAPPRRSTSWPWRPPSGPGPRPSRPRRAATGWRPPSVETPAVTAAVANFLAARGATLTDLVVGKTLEDVYFETVGAAAGTGPPTRRPPGRRAGPAAPAAGVAAGGGRGEHDRRRPAAARPRRPAQKST